MSEDLVERARARAYDFPPTEELGWGAFKYRDLLLELADEIESLREELAAYQSEYGAELSTTIQLEHRDTQQQGEKP